MVDVRHRPRKPWADISSYARECCLYAHDKPTKFNTLSIIAQPLFMDPALLYAIISPPTPTAPGVNIVGSFGDVPTALEEASRGEVVTQWPS